MNSTKLNEMALNEMPMIDTSNNRDSYKYHVKAIKDIYVYIQHIKDSPSKEDIKHIYNMLKRELLFDIEYNAKYWDGNKVNTDSLCKVYDNCIHTFGDMYEKLLGNTSYWDKKYYELYDLLADLESKSGLGIKYSRKFPNSVGLEEDLKKIRRENNIRLEKSNNMSRIEESLYRVSGIRLNEDIGDVAIELVPYLRKLTYRFGLNFNKNPICSEVCDYLEEINPEFSKAECSVYIKDGTDFVPISSHHSVVVNGNEVLDFTNQQYNNYEEYGQNKDCPRVFKHVKDNIYADGNMILALK